MVPELLHCVSLWSGRGGREEETNGKEKEEEAAAVRRKMYPIVYFNQLDCEIQSLARSLNQPGNKCFMS